MDPGSLYLSSLLFPVSYVPVTLPMSSRSCVQEEYSCVVCSPGPGKVDNSDVQMKLYSCDSRAQRGWETIPRSLSMRMQLIMEARE